MATYMNQTNSGRIIVQQTSPSAIIVQPDNERKIILKGSGGLKGETGDAATITVGSTTTGEPGTSASVVNSGTSSDAVLDFVIPKGSKGDKGDTGATGATGPANTLSIGTVQKGDTAEATITGDAPNQTLNLTLPKGDKGDTGSQGPAGEGVAAGGATGQVLTKKSGTDYDTEWATPATYSDFTGATSSVAGSHGLVPAPTTSDPGKFLKGDGTWGTPPGTTYTAGEGIEINSNTIAAKVRKVYDYYTARPASANTTATGNGGMFTFQATNSMTTGKPKNDASILQLEWDNNAGHDTQLAMTPGVHGSWLAHRHQNSGTWGSWIYVLDDVAGSVKTANIDALAVTTAKIADGAITAAKLAPGVVNDATLTITQNGSTLGTFSANASSNVTIDVPGGGSSYTAGVGIEIASGTIGVDDTVALIDDPTTSETPTPWVETSMIENDAVTPEKATFTEYSTTEQVVGTWIDGKPVYRRVISTTSPSTANVGTRVVDITGWNLETLVSDYFQITNPTYNITSSSNSDNVIAYMRLYAQPDNIGYMVNVRNSSYLSKPMIIILEYTKTTD